MLTKLPKIIGISKIRNEAHIIKDTLDNWATICTGGIFVYDDVSDDATVSICQNHPAVKEVILGSFWDPDRMKAEWMNKQTVLTRAQQFADQDTWFVYFDGDEMIEGFTDFELFEQLHIKAIACRLYDFYITKNDVDLNYKKREYIGPEFRTIVFFFRNSPYIRYSLPDQREVTLEPGLQIPIHASIRHYGKGFSVEHWEKTCDYYIKFWPIYSDKWRQRKSKAIHTEMLSDFGNKLILWKDRHKGFTLEDKIYGQH